MAAADGAARNLGRIRSAGRKAMRHRNHTIAKQVRSLLLAAAALIAAASPAGAYSVVLRTDETWLTTVTAPGAGWNDSLVYDDSAWARDRSTPGSAGY